MKDDGSGGVVAALAVEAFRLHWSLSPSHSWLFPPLPVRFLPDPTLPSWRLDVLRQAIC